jgi:hypothetical protein
MEISDMVQRSIALDGRLILSANETTALISWIKQVEDSQKEYAKIAISMEQMDRFIKDLVK